MNEAFIKAILADPDDDAPRLIYADWLDEQGQDQRAEFIRVQCRLATLRPKGRVCNGYYCDEEVGHIDCDDPFGVEESALRRRERELLEAHWLEWRGPWKAGYCSNFDTRHSTAPCGTDDGAVLFRRGFVHSITLSAEDCLAHLDAILKEQPVQEVTLTTWPDLESMHSERREIALALLQRMYPRIKTWHLPEVGFYTNYGIAPRGHGAPWQATPEERRRWFATEEDGRRILNASDGELLRIDNPFSAGPAAIE